MSDVIISIPGATDVVTETGAASSVIVSFPASNNVVTTVIDRGILYGIQGAQGPQGATGATGPQGPKGDTGAGVATGGTAGQVLQKSSSVDYETQWHTLVKSDVGLGNVDNTSDANKPISTAVQTALDSKASTSSLSAHTSDLNNPHQVTKVQVGLGNVDNTSDADKPISTAVQTALNAKANSATMITINGVAYDLSANRSWSVGDVMTSGSYANPSWIASLAWSKISGTPTTLSGYGITDAVPSSRTLTINGVAYDLSANRSWTISEADTLATVTARGATTTTAVTMAGLTLQGAVSGTGNLSNYTVTAASGLGASKRITSTLVAAANNDVLVGLDIAPTFTNGAFTGITQIGARIQNSIIPLRFHQVTGQSTTLEWYNSAGSSRLAYMNLTSGGDWVLQSQSGLIRLFANNTESVRVFGTSNVVIQNGGTFTDAGYRLDVNGTTRFQGASTFTGSVSAASSIARGTYFNQTLVAAANNDVLVGIDVDPTFSVGSFTGVSTYGVRVKRDNLTTTTATYGLQLANTTAATSSVAQQNSPALYFTGSAWVSSALKTFDIAIQSEPQSWDSTRMIWYKRYNNGSWLPFFGLRSDGTGQNSLFLYPVGYLRDAIGQANSVGFSVANGQQATASLQQFSPSFSVQGYGWNGASSTYLTSAWLLAPEAGTTTFQGVSKFIYNDSLTNELIRYEFGERLGMWVNKLSLANYITTINSRTSITGSITASSAIARGTYLNQTLVAAANNDVLVALDIAPTFSVGSFTGVQQIGLRIAGTIIPTINTGFNIGTNNNAYGRIFSTRFAGQSSSDVTLSTTGTTSNINFQLNDSSGNVVGKFFNTTGNFILQNGGTFTDAGYRLDVNGTARIQNALTLGNLASDPTGANGMIYYNTTTNKFRGYENGAWANLI